MRAGSASVDKMAASVNQSSQHTQKFSGSLLTSRASLSLFASATGASASELHHFIQACEGGGIVVGTLVAAFLIGKSFLDEFTEATKRHAAAAAEAAKKQEEFFRSLQKTSQMQGQTPKESSSTQALKAEIDTAEKRIALLKASEKEANESGVNYDKSGALRPGLSKADHAEVSRLQQLIQADNTSIQKRKYLDAIEGLKGGGDAGRNQTIGTHVGVFQVEHGENELDVLKEILAALQKQDPQFNPAGGPANG